MVLIDEMGLIDALDVGFETVCMMGVIFFAIQY